LTFGRVAALAALALFLCLGFVACGKKGLPGPPPGVPQTYPRSYPHE
jgi:hypothetical protein